ncbi:MAG: hypothetical protein R3D33_03865 [Hyphomicrobiaceae bacterium]
MANDDALIGLRFEVGGGLGRMSGRVVGKVGHLYLVERTGAGYLELLELDDLRSAKFYTGSGGESPLAEPATAESATGDAPKRRLSDQIKRHLGAKD